MIRRNLAEALRTARPTDALEIVVHVHTPWMSSVQDELARALATGAISTVAERDALRRAVLARRKLDNAVRLAPITPQLEATGARVTHVCERTPCVYAVGTPAAVARLAALPATRAIGLLDTGESHTYAIGSTAAQFTQTRQFHDYLYNEGGHWYAVDGENGVDRDLTGAILERDGFTLAHASFLDGGPNASYSRVRLGRHCGKTGCDTVTGTWPTTSNSRLHATAMVGLFLGDLTDHQVPGLNYNYEQVRSFASREARAYAYRFHDKGLDVAYADLLDRAVFTPIAVHANGWDDEDCGSTHFSSEAVCENLYQSGVTVFGSAGNSGGSIVDCSARSFANALCTIGVGGYDPFPESEVGLPECIWRESPAHPDSGWGGICDGSTTSSVEGYCRTVIDIAAPMCVRFMPDHEGFTDFLDEAKCGTSAAVAYTAGMANNFVDAYKNFFSDTIDDPGILHAWMLQMGDHADGRFDPRVGGGRAKMRMPNEAGLDGPWSFWSVETCLTDGELIRLGVNDDDHFNGLTNPRRLDADTDVITVAAWFYDREFQTTSRSKKPRVDRYLLRLRDFETGEVLAEDLSMDDKKRVRVTGVGGRRLIVDIIGADISNDNLGCGTNGARMYVSILAEDNTRDDPEGPYWNSSSCIGVEPTGT